MFPRIWTLSVGQRFRPKKIHTEKRRNSGTHIRNVCLVVSLNIEKQFNGSCIFEFVEKRRHLDGDKLVPHLTKVMSSLRQVSRCRRLKSSAFGQGVSEVPRGVTPPLSTSN